MKNSKKKKPKKRLFIATPAFGAQVYTGYTLSLLGTSELLKNNNIPYMVHMIGNESLISRARNECVAVAINENCGKLLFIDADVSWDSRMVLRLLSKNKPVIGGCYPKKAYPEDYAFVCLEDDELFFPEGKRDKPLMENWVRNSRNHIGDGVMKVEKLCTGFLMIDLDVFRRIAQEIPEKAPLYTSNKPIGDRQVRDHFPVRVSNSLYMAEDWSFCENCRSIGIDILLDTACLCGHTGTHTWLPNRRRDG